MKQAAVKAGRVQQAVVEANWAKQRVLVEASEAQSRPAGQRGKAQSRLMPHDLANKAMRPSCSRCRY